RSLKPKNISGLIHAESMISMTLGSPVFSPSRMLVRQMVLFAQWENEQAVDQFLAQHHLGRKLAKGWHTRLKFMRQWGKVSAFEISDRKSTRLNSSHVKISYAVFCLKKKIQNI